MDKILTLGRFLFAFSLTVFGIQYFLYGRFVGGLPVVPLGFLVVRPLLI